MKFQLVDPSYRMTTDLTYHKYAISEAIRTFDTTADIFITRYFFEVNSSYLNENLNLTQLSVEIAKRDPYLNNLYAQYPTKSKNGLVTLTPLLFIQTLN